jgi:membrane carboxypeptidase/penicillin-binding protein PbpC
MIEVVIIDLWFILIPMSGDVLAYVGSADYNNTDIEGQNDMVRNSRQP